ncbi:MAG: hypothetical protein U0792_18695 [Gemmataceae bacterium]
MEVSLGSKAEVDELDLSTVTDFNQKMDILTCVNNVSCLLARAAEWISPAIQAAISVE